MADDDDTAIEEVDEKVDEESKEQQKPLRRSSRRKSKYNGSANTSQQNRVLTGSVLQRREKQLKKSMIQSVYWADVLLDYLQV